MRGYPRWFPRLLAAGVGLLGVTGLLLGTNTLEMRADIQLGWHVAEAARTWSTALHALAGFLIMMFCGALWSIHMRAGWRRGEHRRSGLALALVLVGLALSAIGIYYSGDAVAADWLSYGHLIAGIAWVALLVWHWIRGRRLRRQHLRR